MEEAVKHDLVPDRGTVRLWVLQLLPPAMWAAHLQVGYSLVPTACDAGNRVLLLVVSVICMLVVAVTAIAAWRLWRSFPPMLENAGAGAPEEKEPRWVARTRFMAALGFIGSCLFGLVIVGQSVPMLMLRACD